MTEIVDPVQQAVERLEAAFWRRYNTNPDLQRKLAGKSRIIQLDVTDGPGYVFPVNDGKLGTVEAARHPRPDVTLSLDKATLVAIFNGELRALEAYLSRRVKVKASFRDILFAKSLIGW